jgi:hypothetical protein
MAQSNKRYDAILKGDTKKAYAASKGPLSGPFLAEGAA